MLPPLQPSNHNKISSDPQWIEAAAGLRQQQHLPAGAHAEVRAHMYWIVKEIGIKSCKSLG